MKSQALDDIFPGLESPPSRGAWIEISKGESQMLKVLMSPPSRGAWIEIAAPACPELASRVAPLAGGVD